MKVAVYGGSFDPPHVAHVLAVTYALCIGDFDKVLVAPVYEHAFDKCLAGFEHRFNMCRLALRSLPEAEVSDLESKLPTPSLTLNLVSAIKARHPDYELRLMVGSDVLAEARKWHAFEQIIQVAPLFVVGRPGYEHEQVIATVLPQVSSTRIRKLIGSDQASASDQLAAWLPRRVLRYIREHCLYARSPSTA